MVGILATDFCFVLSIIIFLYQKYRLVTFVIYSCWNLKYTSFFKRVSVVSFSILGNPLNYPRSEYSIRLLLVCVNLQSRSLLGLHYHPWTLPTVVRWQVFNMYYNCVIIMFNKKFHKPGLTGVKSDISYFDFYFIFILNQLIIMY